MANTRLSQDSSVPEEYATAPEGDEPLIVMCLGRSVAPLKKFLETCRDFSEKEREAYVTIRTSNGQQFYGREGWDATILRPIRPLETVHFDEGTKGELVRDIKNYLDSGTRKFYMARGIPYRRGYLLHGPPGTGKTSLSLALAGTFGLELYILHVPSVREDSELGKLFAALPPRCFVLLEDIDAVGTKRNLDEEDEESEDDEPFAGGSNRSQVTLSGMLNCIDGVASQEGRIILMTSNVAHKLDKALIRPGRIDRMIYLGNISPRSAELMFLRMYAPDENSNSKSKSVSPTSSADLEKLALRFGEAIPDNKFTPAQLQGFLLNHRQSPERAAVEIRAWVEEENGKIEEANGRAKVAKEKRAKRREERNMRVLAKNLRVREDDGEGSKSGEKEVDGEGAKKDVEAENKEEEVKDNELVEKPSGSEGKTEGGNKKQTGEKTEGENQEKIEENTKEKIKENTKQKTEEKSEVNMEDKIAVSDENTSEAK